MLATESNLNLKPCIYEQRGHIYRRVLAGQPLPGPSRIMQALGIINPAKYSGGNSPIPGLSPAKFGSAGHLALHYHIKGTLDPKRLHPAFLPRLAAWDKFKADTGFVVDYTEIPLAHQTYPFAGKPDIIGHDAKGFYWILDAKMGGVENHEGVKMGAYELLALESIPIDRRKRAALQLTAEGTYNLVPFEDWTDSSTFLSMLNTYTWGKNHGHYHDTDG